MTRSKATTRNRQSITEPLEDRRLLAATLTTAIADQPLVLGASTSISLDGRFDNPDITGTLVRLSTNLGNITVELFDTAVTGRSAAPITTANFLSYVNAGRYNNTFFHRSIPGFIVQGGGFTAVNNSSNQLIIDTVTANPPIVNEFSADRSNTRGTLAMAKLDSTVEGGGPDSATNQFFFNIANNASTLDSQNGGFTTFARVLDDPALGNDGMNIVDAIAGLQRYNFGAAFTDLPLQNYARSLGTSPNPITPPNDGDEVALANFIRINSASVAKEFEYTVTTSNSRLVVPTITTDSSGNRSLSLAAGNRAGTATITVTARDATGSTTSDTFDVAVRPSGDLGITLAQLPSSTLVGGSSFVLASTITNAGTSRISSRTAVRYFLTADIVDGPETLLTEVSTSAPTTPGQSRLIRKRVTLPTNLPTGSYQIKAVVDPAGLVTDANQTNNQTRSDVVSYQQPFVNLTPAFASPPTGLAGSRVQSFVTLTNNGNVRASGRLTLSLTLDLNNDGTPETVIGTLRSGATLQPGASKTVRVTLNAAALTAATRTLTGSLTITSGYTDSNTADNIFSSTLTLT